MKKLPTESLDFSPFDAHCPTCNAVRKCNDHGNVRKPYWFECNDGRNRIDGTETHFLLECRGCETVFYLRDTTCSEDVDYRFGPNGEPLVEYVHTKITFPAPTSQIKPRWIDAILETDLLLYRILNQTYLAFDNQALILTAVGLRTALDRAAEILGVDPAKSFEKKLTALKNGGWIGETEHDILEVILNAGNAAAHRGWEPSHEEAVKLITATEAFLHRAFIVKKDALEIKAGIPPRPKRK